MSNKSYKKDTTSNSPDIIDVEVISSSENISNVEAAESQKNIVDENKNTNIADLKSSRKGLFRKFFLPVILIIVIIFSILATGLGIAGYNILTEINKISTSDQSSGNIFSNLMNINPFASTEDEVNKVQGGNTGRINLLLLGYGGEGHDGAFLTDSQILISIFPREKKVATLNIPRDTYVNDGGSYKKINAVYADSEYKEKGTGAKKLTKLLENEFNTKIQYWATIDFKGFKKLVDTVGGIDIYVRNSFTDYTYPLGETYEYMYPAPSFTQGQTKMNGDKALIYARSRHAAGPEGGDFARSLRQREVISAVVKKMLDGGLITSPDKISQVLSAVSENLKTNLSLSEMYSLGKIAKDYKLNENIVSWTLSDDSGILCPQNNPDTGYILIYCDGSMFGSSRISASKTELQKNFENILNVALLKKVNNTDVAVVSNKSKVSSVLVDGLKPYKNNSILLNNQYTNITLSVDPKIYVYYVDEADKDVYDFLTSQNTGLSFVKSGVLPETKILPKALSKAKIIFWIE
jgi:LCP family protein required for cell wall assembly